MATNTYVALDTQTLSSTASSVTFSSINQGYTDLVIVVNTRTTYSTDNGPRIQLQFNGDTGSNYSATRVYGTGSAAGSNKESNQLSMTFGYIASSFSSNTNPGNHIVNIQNYSNVTTYKSVLARWNATDNAQPVGANIGLWRSTSAITSILLKPEVGNFVSGSTFTLYGIANSDIGAPKAFGGTITQDANYTYHTFGASGTFTPTQSLTADILVVAGGGGASGAGSGGGGAGGLLPFTSELLTAQSYTVTVGGGGASGGTTVNGSTGADSQFGALTLVKGGGGGGRRQAGLTGGSGGGAGATNTTGYSGGSATSGQGNTGGSSIAQYRGGGGGGASAVGNNGTSGASGNGGAGSNAYSTWASATGTGVSGYYAGGGGGGFTDQGGTGTGGAGGLGGGGAGATASGVAGVAGTPNTGGGGGAGAAATVDSAGGAGGSGVVIIRYAN